jgi:hypothetical protein
MEKKSFKMRVMDPTVVNVNGVGSCDECGLMGSNQCNSCRVINKSYLIKKLNEKVPVFAKEHLEDYYGPEDVKNIVERRALTDVDLREIDTARDERD